MDRLVKKVKHPRSLNPSLYTGLAILLVSLAFIGPLKIAAQSKPPDNSSSGIISQSLRTYTIHLSDPDTIVFADAPVSELNSQAKQQLRDDLSAELARLAAKGQAGNYSYNEAADVFLADLSDAARDSLMKSGLVSSIEPGSEVRPMSGAPYDGPLPAGDIYPQAVSSIIFAQVYTPFMWGRTNIGGLSVDITLESTLGNVKGKPKQTFATAPNDYIKIDPTQLYFETYFVDPNSGLLPVMILPGDRIHIMTSGDDPSTPYADPPEDKRVIVDDVRAWTSYQQDSVSGVGAPNAQIIVTSASSLSLSQYLTPGSSMTYADLTCDSSGNFSTSTFRTTASATYKTVDLKQGATGFVRLRHPDGNEIYTVHGQNVLVLENSQLIHGYAFPLPWPPGGLAAGVSLSAKPATTVNAVLKNSSGQTKDVASLTGSSSSPYTLLFSNATISGSDIVEVTINGVLAMQVATVPVTAVVNLGNSQVSGNGPPVAQMVVGAGQIAGFISKSSQATYIEKRVSTDGSGYYQTGQFQCGTRNLLMRDGSFGYAGYEDGKGNFIYMAYGAPVNYVEANYPLIEGWVADGGVRPQIAVSDSSGTPKYMGAAAPMMLYMNSQRLYINTYYQTLTSQFIVPGDTVNINSGSENSTIPVDKVTSFVNVDNDTLTGEAPAGRTVRVVPYDDRTARREVSADSNGTYSAGSPFTSYYTTSCSETTKNEDFTPGDTGRAFVKHDDGNEVFAVYGRSMHVLENENSAEIYLFATQNYDWDQLPPRRTANITYTPRQGNTVTSEVQADFGAPGKVKLSLVDWQGQRILFRPGDSLSVTFDEGPTGATRSATIALNTLALLTGSPDVDTSTLAGVGPRGWNGTATLDTVSGAKAVQIPPGSYTAYLPLQFKTSTGSLITLVRGYSGTVSFSDNGGHRVWIAWAVTAYQVKITGVPNVGDTKVCGKAAPGSTVNIHDVTSETEDVIIGAGTADGSGNFCVSVSPPLYKGQVLLAEAAGTFSQPVVVASVTRVYLPRIMKSS